LLDDFFSQLGLRASTREVFRGKKSEIRQPDDYRLHAAEFSNLRNQDEGEIPANRAKARRPTTDQDLVFPCSPVFCEFFL
jgi:hypothetical protein